MLSEGERRFKIASSCFGEIPARFEVGTPLSVLTLTQSAVAAAIYTSCGRIGPPPPPHPSPSSPLIFLKRFFLFLLFLAGDFSPFALQMRRHVIKRRTKKNPISSQSTVRAGFFFSPSPSFLMLLFSPPRCTDAFAFPRQPNTARVTVRESKPMHLFQFSHSIDSPSEIYVAFSSRRTPYRVGPSPPPITLQ